MSSRLPTDEALEKEDRMDEMKKKKKKVAHPSRTCCKHNRSLPYHMPSSRTPRHWKLHSTIARPNYPRFESYLVVRFRCVNVLTMQFKSYELDQFNLIIEPRHEKTCFMPYANNKVADQPAYPRSLISTFVFAA